MKQRKIFVAILFVLLILGANLPCIYAHDYPNKITFVNQSGEPVLVKLIGPTGHIIEVPNGQRRMVMVAAGKYYILTRYGSTPEQYSYYKGDSFTITQTATQYSSITITLHKVVGGNYPARQTSHEEFDRAKDVSVKIEEKAKKSLGLKDASNLKDSGELYWPVVLNSRINDSREWSHKPTHIEREGEMISIEGKGVLGVNGVDATWGPLIAGGAQRIFILLWAVGGYTSVLELFINDHLAWEHKGQIKPGSLGFIKSDVIDIAPFVESGREYSISFRTDTSGLGAIIREFSVFSR